VPETMPPPPAAIPAPPGTGPTNTAPPDQPGTPEGPAAQ